MPFLTSSYTIQIHVADFVGIENPWTSENEHYICPKKHLFAFSLNIKGNDLLDLLHCAGNISTSFLVFPSKPIQHTILRVMEHLIH